MSRKPGNTVYASQSRAGDSAPYTYRKRGFLELFAGNFYLDFGRNLRDCILVAGSGRSGTTWLSEMLARRTRSRYIFEPFPLRQYLRPGHDNPENLETVRRILGGKVSGAWPDRFNRRMISRSRVVKDIRANLMLAWLHDHFPETPIVLMLRHPLSVSRSRRKMGWHDPLPELMSDEVLVRDHLLPFEREIRAVAESGDPLERDVHLWCIENYVPLKQIQYGTLNAHIIFYENLVLDPESELRRIMQYVRGVTESDTSVMETRRGCPATSAARIERGEDLDRVEGILTTYGLDYLYETS